MSWIYGQRPKRHCCRSSDLSRVFHHCRPITVTMFADRYNRNSRQAIVVDIQVDLLLLYATGGTLTIESAPPTSIRKPCRTGENSDKSDAGTRNQEQTYQAIFSHVSAMRLLPQLVASITESKMSSPMHTECKWHTILNYIQEHSIQTHTLHGPHSRLSSPRWLHLAWALPRMPY